MKIVTIVSFFLFGMLSWTGSNSSIENGADVEKIRELIRKTTEANNNGDVDGWVNLFDENAVYMTGGQPEVTTRQGLEDIARTGFSSGKTDIVISPDGIEVFGDWAFARSQVTGTFTPINDETPFPVDMKQIVIYRRQSDGNWKIARLIGNSNK
ncbi:SgcJ/EcaC family oxidoreductase [candidate division KSB1 bacterium]|nr:SgcJ/EcaC family oxidoreductase [candidate division KSB1 bacterium]